MSKKKGFPPIVDKNAVVLILGSMPGEESLRLQQYYAHPRNLFWKIIGELFKFDYELPYNERVDKLIQNRITLWDVMRECEREGSLDSSIRNHSIAENDFISFFSEYANIKYIFFNGSKAEQEFKKRVLSNIKDKHKLILEKLPSTSPAMAMMNFEEKLKLWKKIKKVLSE